MTFLPELNNKPQTEVREQLLFADSPSNSIQTLCSPSQLACFPVQSCLMGCKQVTTYSHVDASGHTCTGKCIEMCMFAVVLSTSEYLGQPV